MCRESTTELESRKRELKDIIEKGKKARLQGLSPPASKSNIDKSRKAGKKTHKTIYISWKNYVNDRYALVKADKGGGSRKISFGNDANRAEILESCILEFWNKRKVRAFKTKEDYHFVLGDHKNEILSDVIITTDGEEVPLTAISYIEIHKLTRPRIFFLTKLKSVDRRIADMIEVNNSDRDFEDPKFPYSSMIPENNFFIDEKIDDAVNNTENTSGSIVENSIQNPTDLENMQDSSTPILGSTAEREQLRNVINENLSASLMADERKSETEREKERLDNVFEYTYLKRTGTK